VRHLDSVQNVHAFLDRVNLIAIEVSGALLKLGDRGEWAMVCTVHNLLKLAKATG
jgi:hypothetical protein